MNVYDFDQTIYDGESSIEFVFYYFREDPTLIRFVPALIKALRLYRKEQISLDEFMNNYCSVIEEYISTHQNDFDRCVKAFWDKKMKKIKPFYLENQREDDVVISASPDIILNEVCKRLGIKNLICTHVDLESGKITHPCFREAKIDCFKEVYPQCEIDDFYTDSMNDKFLMPFAKRVFLVKGNKVEQIK